MYITIDGDDVQATAPLDSALVSQVAGSSHNEVNDKGSGDKTGAVLIHARTLMSCTPAASLTHMSHTHTHTHTCTQTHTHTKSYPTQEEASTAKEN